MDAQLRVGVLGTGVVRGEGEQIEDESLSIGDMPERVE